MRPCHWRWGSRIKASIESGFFFPQSWSLQTVLRLYTSHFRKPAFVNMRLSLAITSALLFCSYVVAMPAGKRKAPDSDPESRQDPYGGSSQRRRMEGPGPEASGSQSSGHAPALVNPYSSSEGSYLRSQDHLYPSLHPFGNSADAGPSQYRPNPYEFLPQAQGPSSSSHNPIHHDDIFGLSHIQDPGHFQFGPDHTVTHNPLGEYHGQGQPEAFQFGLDHATGHNPQLGGSLHGQGQSHYTFGQPHIPGSEPFQFGLDHATGHNPQLGDSLHGQGQSHDTFGHPHIPGSEPFQNPATAHNSQFLPPGEPAAPLQLHHPRPNRIATHFPFLDPVPPTPAAPRTRPAAPRTRPAAPRTRPAGRNNNDPSRFNCGGLQGCNYRTNDSTDFRRHQMRKHDIGEKQFKCPDPNCDKAYDRADWLREHQEKNHGQSN